MESAAGQRPQNVGPTASLATIPKLQCASSTATSQTANVLHHEMSTSRRGQKQDLTCLIAFSMAESTEACCRYNMQSVSSMTSTISAWSRISGAGHELSSTGVTSHVMAWGEGLIGGAHRSGPAAVALVGRSWGSCPGPRHTPACWSRS